MRKIIAAVIFASLALCSCDLGQNTPGGKTVVLVSVALDYKGTNVSGLEGPPNDQRAISRQFAHLAKTEGCAFTAVSFTAEDGVWSRFEERWSPLFPDENPSYWNEIGSSSMKAEIAGEIESWGERLDEDDIFVFYYAGHGADTSEERHASLTGAMVVGDITFPSIGDWRDQDSNMRSLITLPELKAAVADLPCPKLLILDSCYSGAMIGDNPNLAPAEDILENLANLRYKGDKGNGNLFMMAASRADERSWEDDEAGITHGKFTLALAEAMGYKIHADGVEGPGLPSDCYISLTRLISALEGADVTSWQTPGIGESLSDLVLFRLPATCLT